MSVRNLSYTAFQQLPAAISGKDDQFHGIMVFYVDGDISAILYDSEDDRDNAYATMSEQIDVRKVIAINIV